jgi:NAD(P)-dependent dehydrogenase (short-subunit alcohol dehydrogenase family)
MAQKQRVAFITGAASGLGLSTAERLAAEGCVAVLVDRADKVLAVAERLRGEGRLAEGHVASVTDEAAMTALVSDLATRHGGIDILVNNAGGMSLPKGGSVAVEDLPTDLWTRTIAVNLTAPFVLCRLALPAMKAKGWGRIINIASRAGRMAVPDTSVSYAATKAGLIGMTRIVADQGAKFGITANCIAPGRIATPGGTNATDAVMQNSLSRIPVGRLGLPTEIAATISFLVSDGAAYITGAVIDVNGGAFMT